MKTIKLSMLAAILAPFLIASGLIIYAITGEMGTLSITLMWVGLLMLLLLFMLGIILVTMLMQMLVLDIILMVVGLETKVVQGEIL